jgi:hypothetical protein
MRTHERYTFVKMHYYLVYYLEEREGKLLGGYKEVKLTEPLAWIGQMDEVKLQLESSFATPLGYLYITGVHFLRALDEKVNIPD